MKTAKAHRKFAIYSVYLDTWLEGEEEVREGETRKDALKRIISELEETATELRKEAESKSQNVPLPDYNKFRHSDQFYLESNQTLPTISLEHERMEIEIDNCTSIIELMGWKEANPLVPAKILNHYSNRIKELSG